MLCTSCSKLATLYINKNCIRCQNPVHINLAVLCEFCSNTENKCAICVKTIVQPGQKRGCNCGKK